MDRQESNQQRPLATTLLALFCAASVVFLVSRDLFLPHVRDTEVWFGFEFHGLIARITAPLHWLIFVVGSWGFWRDRSWIWPAAIGYASYVATSHVVWNFMSPSGGGGIAALWQLALFSLPVILLVWLRPESAEE
jgi:hypothetical protein